MIKYIGIDGCKSGWFYVGVDQAGNSSFGVFCEISELSAFFALRRNGPDRYPHWLEGVAQGWTFMR